MRIAVTSHTPIDQIESRGSSFVGIGGPTCYSGMTIKSLGADVQLVTKVGRDFDYRNVLNEKGLQISDACISASEPTTRFRLVIDGRRRNLFLLAKCEDIADDEININADACVVSPIINEISGEVVREISKQVNFVFLDPQGFVRKFRKDGSCYIEKIEMNIHKFKINAIKVDDEEAFALTGVNGVDALKKLKIETAILTSTNRTTMLCNERIYEISTEMIDVQDSTGTGDILSGAYTYAFVNSKDARWALCLGVAASFSALKSNATGISKVPLKNDIENYATILHNNIKSVT
ncbi:MAG: PfkB family carbohydrate kinase [Nitrososphaerales archaeon]